MQAPARVGGTASSHGPWRATQNGSNRSQSLNVRNTMAVSYVSEALSQSILVVDDDIPFRVVLCRTLRREGLTALEASNGIEAVQELKRETPYALITDMLMPECDGVELIVAARRLCPTTPIIAMSAQSHIGHLDLLDLAMRIGADAVYSKSHDVKVLLEILQGLSI